MDGAILFSEVQAASTEYPEVVSALRSILTPYTPPAAPSRVRDRLAGVEHPGPVQDDILSMLRTLRGEQPTLSYLEALGLLLAAALPADVTHAPEPTPEDVTCACHVFDLLVEQWPLLDPQGIAIESPVDVATPAYYTGDGLGGVDTQELGSALSRALARSAGESEAPQVPRAAYASAVMASTVPPSPPQPLPAGTQQVKDVRWVPEEATGGEVASAAANLPPQARPMLQAVQQQDTESPSFVPRRTPVATAETKAADAGRERRQGPFLLVAGSLVLGGFLGFALFRFGSHVASVPAPPPIAAAPASVAGPSNARRTHAVAPSVSGANRAVAGAPAEVAEPPMHGGKGRSAAEPTRSTSAPGARNSTGSSTSEPATAPAAPRGIPAPSLVPAPRAVSLGAPSTAAAGNTRLPSVTVGSAGVMAANLITSPAPAYPAEARAAHVQGEVVVEAVVGKDGAVEETRIVSGPLLLQDAAQRAVQRWRYRPWLADGKPAEILATARIEFRLGPHTAAAD